MRRRVYEATSQTARRRFVVPSVDFRSTSYKSYKHLLMYAYLNCSNVVFIPTSMTYLLAINQPILQEIL